MKYMLTFEEYFYGKNNVKGFLKHGGKDVSRKYKATDFKDYFINSLKKKEEPEKEQDNLPEIDINFSDELLSYEKFENITENICYHVTAKSNLESIKNIGLIVSDSKTFKEMDYPNAIYFSKSLIGAKMNLIDISQYLKKDLKNMAIIEFELPNNIESFKDEEMGNDSFYIKDNITKDRFLAITSGEIFIRK